MNSASVLYLAAVISAHRDRQVIGRTRLQKTIKLLQSLGLPTDYGYSIHFYGPYSEGLQADTSLLKDRGLLDETSECVESGHPRYTFRLNSSILPLLPDITGFKAKISKLEDSPSVVLELAATYDAFREQCATHEKAMEWLHMKKGGKCSNGNADLALTLLRELRLLPRERAS